MKDRSVEERTPRARLNANRGEAGQLARLKSAALLVRVGLDHEPWLRRALARLGDGAPAPGGPRDLDLSRSITLLQTETPRLRADPAPHQHGFGNPAASSWPGAASWSPATAWCCARCARRRESVSATG